ncbi:MAG: TetR family transcriptional regulator [Methyloligella sp.]|nr:MAG: TetR family transcriptional regulator [Methyloligella sp.]
MLSLLDIAARNYWNMTLNKSFEENRQRILKAASEQFLLKGYDETRLDDIVKNARVSKTAIYTIFGGKRELFIAISEDLSEQLVHATISNNQVILENIEELEQLLSQIGENYLKITLEQDKLANFRMCLSMASRAQEVAKQFYYSGHAKICDYLSNYLEAANKANLLDISNSNQAACQFLSLVRGDTHLRALFDIDYAPSETSIQEAAQRSVHLFMKGYVSNEAPARL